MSSSHMSFGSNMLFQTINDDLNASLATADELSKEFNSLLQEASSTSSSNNNNYSNTKSQFTSSSSSITPRFSSSSIDGISSSSSSSSFHHTDSIMSSNKNTPSSPVITTSPHSSPKLHHETRPTHSRSGSDGYLYGQQSPKTSPHPQRHDFSPRYDRSPRGSISYVDRCPSPNPNLDQSARSGSGSGSGSSGQTSYSSLLSPYESSQMGRYSPRLDRAPSPLSFSHTLPRSSGGFRQSDEGMHRQKSPGKWNETDLDVSYDRKPHHTYDKTEWLRPSVPNSSWRESNLDGPPPAPSPKKDPRSNPLQYSHGSLPRNSRISVPPDVSSSSHSHYHPQPIISRISIPPASTQSRQRKPIPLSVIMRLQNPHWRATMPIPHPPRVGEGDVSHHHQPAALTHREFFHQHIPLHQPHPQPAELRQPAVYSDALNPGDVDAELERLDYVRHIPVIPENPTVPESGPEVAPQPAPRPLSPTRLQPVVAPEAQTHVMPDVEELLRIRAEIPRALKRRGSVDQSRPLKKASHYQPNQYKYFIGKFFHKKEHRHKGEQGSETGSSSEGEESATPPAPLPPPHTPSHHDVKNYHSILRRHKKERKSSGKRARLSPLILLLDGALVGELDTVQRAVQEMTDPSQPNDEGITGLHNAICGGHYDVVDFLVRIGANVSSPDSHGWTPLHCAASCNDRVLCEFLVRNGAAVMAMTESDGATASQKCDPYAPGFEECLNFLKGVEEAMGVENSGVLYALWSYPAQAHDELSFKEGDMVTILQKPEGSDWWWASLCGREGFVPINYFGLFPKVRPKSLC